MKTNWYLVYLIHDQLLTLLAKDLDDDIFIALQKNAP